MKRVIDTNVLLVANAQHPDVSPECTAECIRQLQAVQKGGTTVIDDEYRILGEYQHKTRSRQPKGTGDVFLKWLLRNTGNPMRVEQVAITETAPGLYAEFPDPALQPHFDPPDRVFPAVANAHPEKPRILQAADCKWMDWWQPLAAYGITIDFLCPRDVCDFYAHKFPGKPVPALPEG